MDRFRHRRRSSPLGSTSSSVSKELPETPHDLTAMVRTRTTTQLKRSSARQFLEKMSKKAEGRLARNDENVCRVRREGDVWTDVEVEV